MIILLEEFVVVMSIPLLLVLVGGPDVGAQTARNPVNVSLESELNLTSTVLELVMIVNGVSISPQYFSSSISNQSYAHEL